MLNIKTIAKGEIFSFENLMKEKIRRLKTTIHSGKIVNNSTRIREAAGMSIKAERIIKSEYIINIMPEK